MPRCLDYRLYTSHCRDNRMQTKVEYQWFPLSKYELVKAMDQDGTKLPTSHKIQGGPYHQYTRRIELGDTMVLETTHLSCKMSLGGLEPTMD